MNDAREPEKAPDETPDAPSVNDAREPEKAPAAQAPASRRGKREPHGYRVSKDIIIGTRSGNIRVPAHKPIRDPYIIGHLKRSGVKLEPFYDD